MGFDNIYDDQLNSRREYDAEILDAAFCNLAAVLDRGLGKKSCRSEIRGAVAQILNILGVAVPDVPENITDINLQLQYMLRPSGTMRRRVELAGNWWQDATGCLLGSTVDGDIIVMRPGYFSGYQYEDKQGKTIKINKKNAAQINCDAFCFYRPLPATKLSLPDLYRFMLASITRADIYFVVGGSLLVSLIGMIMPYMNNQIFDNVIPSGIKGNIMPIAGLLVGIGFATVMFWVTRNIILNRFRDKINLSVQSAAMMRLYSLPATFFRDYSAGELSSRTLSINKLCTLLTDAVLTSGLTALFSFVYVFQMYVYAPSLVLPGLLCIFLLLCFSVLISLVQLKISRKRATVSAKLSGLVYALFTGVQKIKLAGAEKRAFAKWASLYKEQSMLSYAPPLVLKISPAISMLLTVGSSIVLYYFAGRSQVSPADYMAFNVAYGAVSSAMLALARIARTAADIKPMLEMVQPIIQALPENAGRNKVVNSLSGKIEINDISFRYGKDLPLVLDQLSLKIKSGEYVAIVGRTGCGKSTLLRLLLGFEHPETGAIYYDGHDLATLNLTALRQCMAVDMQGGRLFAGSIFSNIVVAAPWKTMEDAWEAATIAGIDDDIREMPMGMLTTLSEGGGGISGGQRQRLLIARAIVSKPKIVFFDEATSALDNVTQKHVSERITGLACTRLVIAHRLSTIRNCNRIIVLEGGKIVEDGDYETLMAAQGHFYELAKRQTL